jgi:hypothetical protein
VEADLVLHGVLLPAACALAFVIAAARRHPRWMGAALLVSFAVSVRNFDPIEAVPSGAWTASVLALGSMVLVATVAGGACGSRGVRGVVCAVAAALAALLLPMPEWRTADARMLLAFALAASSALLLPPGMHRGGFSFWCAQSVALAACSVLALSVGFAKLALPVGAASAVCGWIGVLAIFTRPHRAIHAGISGSIAIAGIAGLAAATAFAFETGGTPKAAFVCAGLAPLGCWLGELPPFRASRMASGLARIAGCAALAGLVVAIAARSPDADAQEAYAVTDVERPVLSHAALATHR